MSHRKKKNSVRGWKGSSLGNSVSALLDERAWEPGRDQTLVSISTSGTLPSERETIIRTGGRPKPRPGFGCQCCPGRARMRGPQRGLL